MTIRFQDDKLHFCDHPKEKCIEIEGIKYSYDFFKALGWEMRLNQPFVIVKRQNNIITVEKVEK